MTGSQTNGVSRDLKILILEDNPGDRELLEYELREAGFVFILRHVEDEKSFIEALEAFHPDIILSDYDLPTFTGWEALQIRKKLCPDTPFILITGAVGEERAIEVLTGGATDYVLKRNLSKLPPAVHRALHEAYEHRKRKEAEAERDNLLRELEKRVQERTEALQSEIAERRQAEEALKHRTEVLQTILDTAPIAIFIAHDQECRRISGNPAAQELVELAPDANISKSALAGERPTAWQEMRGGVPIEPENLPLQRAVYGEEVRDYEMDLVFEDGRVKSVVGNATPIRDENGKPRGAVAILMDITDRKRAEAGLRRSEERYRRIVDTAEEGIATHAPDGTITYVNQRMADMLGCSREEIVGRSSLVFVDDEEKDKVIRARENLNDRVSFSKELRLRRKDGSVLWSMANISPRKDESGNFLGYLAMHTDISDRKRIEEELRAKKAELELILNLTPLMLTRCSRNLRYLYASPATARMLKRTQSEMVGKPIVDIIGEKAFRTIYPHIEAVLQGQTVEYEDEIDYLNAGRRDVLVTYVPDRDGRGEVIGWTASIFDITELKKARCGLQDIASRLEHTNDLFKGIIESTTGLIAAVDTDFRYLAFNETYHKECRAIYGIDLSVGDSMLEMVAPYSEDQKNVVEIFGPAFKGKSVVTTRIFGDPVKKRRVYEMHVSPIYDARGRIIGAASINTDITERRQAEEALKNRTAELEAANKELESFTYSVSHDLRAPLRAISGFLGMLVNDLDKKLDREEKRKFNVISENATKMNQMIESLLSLSRLSRIEMNFAKVDMKKMAESVWDQQLQADPETPYVSIGDLPDAFGDSSLLWQVFSNLVGNAAKYTRKRRKPLIEVGGGLKDGETVYYVKDNGVGFDMRQYDKLFGVFQRLHPESEYEGTGVGLAIVQRVIQRHGGRVWAEGKIGKGATFYFSLPAN